MKKCIVLLLALCLLLGGCLEQPATQAEKPAPTPAAEQYAPYYTDAALRGLQADVTYSSDVYTPVGRLNNLYNGWAQGLYETLGVADLALSQLSVPDTRWVRMAFSTAAGEKEEVFTLYENNLVVAAHPTKGERRCVAAGGTYEAVLAYLDGVSTAQSRYFAVSAEHTAADGYHPASYTLFNATGTAVVTKETGDTIATVELVGEGLVRVTDPDGTRLYAPHQGKKSVLSTGPTDLSGDRLAVCDADGVAVYTLFGTKPLCRIYLAAAGGAAVQGLDFSADGSELHVLVQNASGSLYDRTVTVQEEMDGSERRMLGDWRSALTPATEKEEQITAYNILKKLRHREKEQGYFFSGILMGHLMLEGKDHFLCELGHWTTDEEGAKEYVFIGYLLVPADLSAGYAAELTEDELVWDTNDNWFKK